MPQGGYPIPPAELVVGPFGGEFLLSDKHIESPGFHHDQVKETDALAVVMFITWTIDGVPGMRIPGKGRNMDIDKGHGKPP